MKQTTDIALSVVIVNYNVRYFLEQALLAVRKAATGLPIEVFVVDNNSVDDSVQMVKDKFPEVKLIANTSNPGFSIANNQAIRESSGKYVLLLNPDTVVEEDTFRICLEFMDQHPDAGGLGVKMIDGSGKFLPESKRGFPNFFVAFCKTVGLSTLFPKSRLFNRYHLGYLDKDENHEVDVLSGAFMLMRRSVLDEIGLLDEDFFMYGEDIDLSYRIVKAGYKNYYLSDTTILHYKGESTKKGSLNYVYTFYNAMIIFARKHFQGEQARTFIFLIQVAIYFRATLTLLTNTFKRIAWPLLDAAIILVGLFLLKDFWAHYYYKDPNYYQDSFVNVNFPLYTIIWLAAIYFNGGYDAPYNLRRLNRGLLLGTLLLAAVYGFLPLEYRPSRAIILMGATWALGMTSLFRTMVHFARSGNFQVGRQRTKNLVIVGEIRESERVQQLLTKAEVRSNFIGTVAPEVGMDPKVYLSSLDRLEEVVYIYRIDEIIFCSQDVPAQEILRWMSHLGPEREYKIVPQESWSIIGSSSKNESGELYTVDIKFQIATPLSRRNKRSLDVLICLLQLILLPFILLLIPTRAGFVQNWWHVLLGQKTWVSYAAASGRQKHPLPSIRPGILSPRNALNLPVIDAITRHRLNFIYAKDYRVGKDLEIILKGWKEWGKRPLPNAPEKENNYVEREDKAVSKN